MIRPLIIDCAKCICWILAVSALLYIAYSGIQNKDWYPAIISVCTVLLILSADRIVRLRIGKVNIELKQTLNEAKELFEGLKQLADTMSSSVIKQIAHGTWNGGQDKYDFYHDILMFDELRKNMKVEEYGEYLQMRNLAILRTAIFTLSPLTTWDKLPSTATEIDAKDFIKYIRSRSSMKKAANYETQQHILYLCEKYKTSIPSLELERIKSCAKMLTVFKDQIGENKA